MDGERGLSLMGWKCAQTNHERDRVKIARIAGGSVAPPGLDSFLWACPRSAPLSRLLLGYFRIAPPGLVWLEDSDFLCTSSSATGQSLDRVYGIAEATA
jgi:hypothetical protein